MYTLFAENFRNSDLSHMQYKLMNLTTAAG